MTDKIPLLIDTDPGVDDALALLMAFNDPRHEVVGLTIAAGNVGLAHTVANALKLCEVAGATSPVFAGCAAPLLHPARGCRLRARQRRIRRHRLRAGRRARPKPNTPRWRSCGCRTNTPARLLLVALGPLTNLALALKLDPTLPQRVARWW